MVKLNYPLKASTLIESLIAMVIIVVCLCVATMIYSNVINSDKQVLQLKAMCFLNKKVVQTKAEKSFLDSEQQTENWDIKKTVEKYDQTENVYALTLSVFDKSGRLIAVRKELIIVE